MSGVMRHHRQRYASARMRDAYPSGGVKINVPKTTVGRIMLYAEQMRLKRQFLEREERRREAHSA